MTPLISSRKQPASGNGSTTRPTQLLKVTMTTDDGETLFRSPRSLEKNHERRQWTSPPAVTVASPRTPKNDACETTGRGASIPRLHRVVLPYRAHRSTSHTPPCMLDTIGGAPCYRVVFLGSSLEYSIGNLHRNQPKVAS